MWRRIQALERPDAPSAQQLTVHSRPAGANLSIDGKAVGVTPFSGSISPGLHTLELRQQGFSGEIRDFEVQPDRAKEVEVVLAVRREAPSQQGAPAAPMRVTWGSAGPPHSEAVQPAARAADEAAGMNTMSVLGWLAVGSAAAALGGALTFELLRAEDEDRARHAATQIDFHERVEDMHAHQTAARVLAGVGGGLALLGATLLFVDASGDESNDATEAPRLSAQLMFEPHGAAGAQLRARY